MKIETAQNFWHQTYNLPLNHPEFVIILYNKIDKNVLHATKLRIEIDKLMAMLNIDNPISHELIFVEQDSVEVDEYSDTIINKKITSTLESL